MGKKSDVARQARLLARSLALFAILYLSFFAISGLVIWGCYWWLSGRYWPSPPIFILLIGALLFLVKMAASFCRVQRINRPDLKIITRKSQPQLFRVIDGISGRMRIKPPKRVYLSATVSASVFLKAGFWNVFFPARKNLEIGMGLVNILNEEELKAVLSHELGHFSQEKMRLGVPVYIIGQSLQHLMRNMKKKRDQAIEERIYFFVDLFRMLAERLFMRLSKDYVSLLEEMEYDADWLAMEHVGKKALESALLKVTFASHIFDLTIDSAGIILQSEKTIADLYAAQRCMAECFLPGIVIANGAFLTKPGSGVTLSNLTRRRMERLHQAEISSAPENPNPVLSAELVDDFPNHCLAFTREIYQHQFKINTSKLPVCNITSYRKWIRKHVGRSEVTEAIPEKETEETEVEIILKERRHKAPLTDWYFDVCWDDKKEGEGWYKKGVTLKIKTHPGNHVLKIEGAQIGESELPFTIERPGYYTIYLDYQYHFWKSEFRFSIKTWCCKLLDEPI